MKPLSPPRAEISHSNSALLEPLEASAQARPTLTRSQLGIHSVHAAFRERVIFAFSESKNQKLNSRADRLDWCCAFPMIGISSAGRPVLSMQCCRDRMCPQCQHQRTVETTSNILTSVMKMNSPRLITLTLRHRSASLAQELARLADCFRRIRREKQWKKHVFGGIYAIEITRNLQTERWHVHIHVIADGEFWAQKSISKLWLKITGDSDVVDVRAIHDKAKISKYIAKYVAKPTEMKGWDNRSLCEYALALHGKRLVHTFGSLHGQTVDKEKGKAENTAKESLGTVDRLVRWARLGYGPAVAALEILNRLGRRWRAASGVPRAEWDHPAAPVLVAEEELLIVTMRELMRLDVSGITRSPPESSPLKYTTSSISTATLWATQQYRA